jgi:ribosomal protein S18 acetylase RimI-like enzyme
MTVLGSASSMPDGISVRPAQSGDKPFLETLYHSARGDLGLIQGEADMVQNVRELQYRVLQEGAGNEFPNAMHFVIEKVSERVGGLIVDFGHNEVRVVYLAFIPQARGLGYGRAVLQGVQKAAATAGSPVTVTVWHNNPDAKRHYLALGFKVEESTAVADRMVWYPTSDAGLRTF